MSADCPGCWPTPKLPITPARPRTVQACLSCGTTWTTASRDCPDCGYNYELNAQVVTDA